MRQLATIKTISDIQPIPGADRIELALIDGWKVVVKKGEFSTGDECVYFEIDSIIPTTDSRFSFLDKDGKPHRLRTIKLRKQISQGLALPKALFAAEIKKGGDLATALRIGKYEEYEEPKATKSTKPWWMPGWLLQWWFKREKTKGNFPSFIPKTDQERVQNLSKLFTDATVLNTHFDVTIKYDGSSMTVYKKDKEIGVCSRNLCVWKGKGKPKIVDRDNFTKVAIKVKIAEALYKLGRNLAIQGELVGPKVNGNRAALADFDYRIFDVYDIDAGKYLGYTDRIKVVDQLQELGFTSGSVHVVASGTLQELGLTSVEACLKMATEVKVPGNNNIVEGVVLKSFDRKTSFKAVSNEYLLKWNCG